MKRVTLKDVAARAGVSFSTVSRALNDRPEISAQTKAQVNAACKELGYIPNIAARGLVRRETRTIGLLVPDISNDYFAGVALAVEETARENGYRVLVCSSLRDPVRESEALDGLLSQQVDGVILAPVSVTSARQLEQMLQSVPHIYLGNNHSDTCSYVVVDNKRGAYEATRYLLCLGHRNILFLGGHTDSLTRQYRVRGFRKAMEETADTKAQELVECDSAQQTDRMIEHLLREKDLPDAIFAYSDRIALRVLQAADECGIAIPDQLSLMGFDNISYADLPRINLTTVSQHKGHIGHTAVLRLLAQIGGSTEQTVDVLKPELMIRGTCRARSVR